MAGVQDGQEGEEKQRGQLLTQGSLWAVGKSKEGLRHNSIRKRDKAGHVVKTENMVKLSNSQIITLEHTETSVGGKLGYAEREVPAGQQDSTHVTDGGQLLPGVGLLHQTLCLGWADTVVINCKLGPHEVGSRIKRESHPKGPCFSLTQKPRGGSVTDRSLSARRQRPKCSHRFLGDVALKLRRAFDFLLTSFFIGDTNTCSQ